MNDFDNIRYPSQKHQPKEATQRLQSQPAPALFKIVQQYCTLSKLDNPSEQDFTRIEAILQLAECDPELSCLLNQADHLIAYELNLLTDLLPTGGPSNMYGNPTFSARHH